MMTVSGGQRWPANTGGPVIMATMDPVNLACVFRAKSAIDSGMKSATDSDVISAIPI